MRCCSQKECFSEKTYEVEKAKIEIINFSLRVIEFQVQYLVRPAVAHICSRPIVAATLQLPGADWRNCRRPHWRALRAQSGCDVRLVKDHTRKLHASTAIVAFESVNFECAFKKLCPGNSCSFLDWSWPIWKNHRRRDRLARTPQ